MQWAAWDQVKAPIKTGRRLKVEGESLLLGRFSRSHKPPVLSDAVAMETSRLRAVMLKDTGGMHRHVSWRNPIFSGNGGDLPNDFWTNYFGARDSKLKPYVYTYEIESANQFS